ncbi:COPII coat Sec23p-Sfb3p heterodimer component [Vermiconidia calcicola]|uniref:COPII coat Sec23p-Sfb3p heterodimer component n=1 Tax=Vermiconidia calcicola TaxID=1690605 RepID=A0ACC3N4M1_9PEZI|nr:COPII coat Sec23p-Sfb3p heterodimer component [Vermiconidia calcicola]
MQQGYEQYGGQHGGQQQHLQPERSLSRQLSQVSLDGSAQPHARKKKDRHAYHQMDTPVASPGGQYMNGQIGGQPQPGTTPGPGTPGAAPWQQQHTPTQPWQSQSPAQGMNQPIPQAGTPISMNAGGGPQQGQFGGGGQGRVNPDHIPSVPLSRDQPAEYYRTHMYPTMEQRVPPPATTPLIAYDQGNASPKHARLTTNCIPSSQEQLAATALPLGLVLQPLAKQGEGEQAIPVLDFGEIGPPRCKRCRAYVNPFMIFSNGGNKMNCNLCGHPGDIQSDYFAPTDPSGVRVDRAQRPELLLGTCEFLVPKEYWSKEPVALRYLFLIDVSAEACNRGFVQGVCDGILAALYGDDVDEEETNGEEEPNGETETKPSKVPAGAKVGFMTFDREIHFYNISPSQPAPQQLVMSDLEDPFAAISAEYLFVDAAQSKKNIISLMKSIPEMFFNIKHAEPALLPSLQAALSALEASGGKIICSLGSLPTYGPGKLQVRDKGQTQGDDDHNRKLLKTEHPGFTKMQADLVKAGVGIDFFLAAPSGGYLDIATIGYVAEKTGGETYYFPNWTYPRDLLRLAKELSHTVQRDQGYAALMKVRCSNGLQVSHYSGNFTQHTFGADLELASVTEDSGMCVTFTYDGKLDTKTDTYFQSALLYTTASGQRQVRCTNVVAHVNESARESMKMIDQDAVVGIMAKESAAKVHDRSLKDVRQHLHEKSIDILAGYRKHFSGSHPPGQLVLPENLKEFAMYMLGLIKSRALKSGHEPSDRRIYEVRLLRGMGPAELSLYLYPRIIALHSLEPEEGFADENGHLKIPHGVRASFSQIEEGGAYLVDNGQILLLWLHAQVSPNLLEDLFGEGCDDLQKIDPNLSAPPVLDTLLNAQVRNILLSMEEGRGSKGLAIQLARQGLDGAEFEFARLLYEDRNGEASSYVDWLVMLHRGVGTELSGQRSKESGDGVGHTITNTISGITGYMSSS